jgi:hypothetical protein
MGYVSAFFESVAGDRLYTANRWAQIFNAIQTQGYIPDYESEMLVVESSPAAMTTRISPGAGFVEGRYIEITSYETITHAAAHATLHRKDLVILRLDLNTGVRDLFPTVLQGANAATQGAAVVPTLTQNSTIYEVALAEVHIPPLDTAIQNAQITDRRESLWGRASYPDLTEHKALATLDHPDGSVTTDKIADLGVTTPKLQNGAVTTDKLFDGAVLFAKIGDAQVTETKLGTGAVTTDKIADLNVTTGKLADLAVTAAKLAVFNGDAKIAPGTVTGNGAGSAIPVDVVHANRLVAGSLTAAELWRIAGTLVDGDYVENASLTYVELAGAPYVHGENVTPTALTSGTPTMLTVNVPVAGRYLVTMTAVLSAVDSSTGDNGQALQAYLIGSGGLIGQTLQGYVHTFSPAQNQDYCLNITYNLVLAASAPISVIARKTGGSGNSQFRFAYLDALWIAHS